MTAPTLRLADARDAAGCRAIYAPIVEDTMISFEEIAPSVDAMAGRIARITARYPWLVAERGGMLVGYAYGSEHRARPGYRWSTDVSVYLDASARGQGIGRALYAALLAILTHQGFHRAHAGIALPNDASVALHRSVGFEPVGVYPDVGSKFGRWYDVAWFTRVLAPAESPPREPIAIGEVAPETLRACGVTQ